jgi:hypothetical protein
LTLGTSPQTNIGAFNERTVLQHFFDGRLAEAAVWTGSGVETMGAAQAAILAGGLRPDLLEGFESQLVFYEDIKTGINGASHIGNALTNVDVTFSGADHPAIFGGFVPSIMLTGVG